MNEARNIGRGRKESEKEMRNKVKKFYLIILSEREW